MIGSLESLSCYVESLFGGFFLIRMLNKSNVLRSKDATRGDNSEIPLKLALNTNQSINPRYRVLFSFSSYTTASSAVDRGFETRSGQTKKYIICICCFSAMYATLRSKSKDRLYRIQHNTHTIVSVSYYKKNPTKPWSSTKWTLPSSH